MEQRELEQIKSGLQYRFDLFKGRRKDYLYFVAVKDYSYFIVGNPLLKEFADTAINAPKAMLDAEIEKIRSLVHKDINKLSALLSPEIDKLCLENEKLRASRDEFIENDKYNDVSSTAYHLARTIEIAATLTRSPTIQSLCSLTSEGGMYKVKADDKMYYEVEKSKISQSLPAFEKLIEKRKKQGETMLWGSFALLGTAAACVNKIENGETEEASYYVKEMIEVWEESSPNSQSKLSTMVNSAVRFPGSVTLNNGLFSPHVPDVNQTNYFLRTDYDFHAQKIHNCLIEFLDREILGFEKLKKIVFQNFENGTLYFAGKEITISKTNKETYQTQLLNTLLKEWRYWFKDEIMEDWGYRDGDETSKNKAYFAARKINELVKMETGIDDFIDHNTDKFRINLKYMKS